jgi:hypothetical protein
MLSSAEKIKLLLAKKVEEAKARATEHIFLNSTNSTNNIITISPENIHHSHNILDIADIVDRNGKKISYNKEQQAAIHLASQGKSFNLIGSAGTGKTTTSYGMCSHLINKYATEFLNSNHKYIRDGALPILIVSYTNLSVINIQNRVPPELVDNCMTIHKLLEYKPERRELITEDGTVKYPWMFVPGRNAIKPLPEGIRVVIFEESGLIDCKLYLEFKAALPHNVQEIFLGDMNQLSTIFSPQILGFKVNFLPSVELTEVHRQALDSPILKLATDIKNGITIPLKEFETRSVPGKLRLHPWKKEISLEAALAVLGKEIFPTFYKNKLYNPMEDIIIMPYNKSFGTIELNKYIAQMLTEEREADVYEIIQGYAKYYYAVGDKVFYEKFSATITDIRPNPKYYGVTPAAHSKTMNYWGIDKEGQKNKDNAEVSDKNLDDILAQFALQEGEDIEERKLTPSHIVTVYIDETGRYVDIVDGTSMGRLELGYCLTMRKAQGSEWRRVFALVHHSNWLHMSREALYTMVTRAREELYMICPPDLFIKGVERQSVPGKTLLEKAEAFKGNLKKFDFDVNLLK